MNRFKYLFLFSISLLLFIACNKEEHDFINYPDIDEYVVMLKNGDYQMTDKSGIIEIPNFRKEHIPQLLEYVEDLTLLPEAYPINPVSSAKGPDRLGEALLWTIEGIISNEKYPSYSGHLMKKEISAGQETLENCSDEEVLEAAKLYKRWWNGEYPFNKLHDKYSMHPLEDTSYCWN